MNENSPATPDFPVSEELLALLRLQDRLMHVSRFATVGEMSAGIAHELNQPLCAIANYAQACDRLLRSPDPDIAEIRDSLQEIAAQALRAGEIIRRLRNLARPQTARREPADINAVVGELTDLIQSDTKHHGVRYRFEAGSGLPSVEVDAAQIQQLVLNLVRNAVEALSGAPAECREMIVRTGVTGNGDVELCVCDRGPGVSSLITARLFDPFCTTKPAGTGLGLAISRTIAAAHRGTLIYRSNFPSGACFALTLPAVHSHEFPAAANA
jgi:two-component system, LuxR family, sensor kinase FixL